MKKLVMMLALAVAVCSAKAACVDWKVSSTSDQVGTTVYLMAAIGDFADASALASAAIGSAEFAFLGRGKYGTPDLTANNDAITSDGTYYFVIVSADGKSFNYVEATGMGAKVYDPNNQETSKGVFNTISSADILAGTSKTFGGGSGGDIPEPTSGLLLLVGGAALALRRKQR